MLGGSQERKQRAEKCPKPDDGLRPQELQGALDGLEARCGQIVPEPRRALVEGLAQRVHGETGYKLKHKGRDQHGINLLADICLPTLEEDRRGGRGRDMSFGLGRRVV